MSKSYFTAVVAVLLAANTGMSQVGTGVTAVATTTASAAAVPANVAITTPNSSQGDAEFVAKAAAGGLFEVQSSQLATTRSQSAEIRTFAQQMIADHSKANQELAQLAQAKGITVPSTLDPKHATMIDRLNKADDEKFDTVYGRMQARAHQEAVALFQTASASVTDPDLKAYAAKTLPVLQHHTEMTKALPGADKAGEKMPGKKGKKDKPTKDTANE